MPLMDGIDLVQKANKQQLLIQDVMPSRFFDKMHHRHEHRMRERELRRRKTRLRNMLQRVADDDDDILHADTLASAFVSRKRRRILEDRQSSSHIPCAVSPADLRKWACATDVDTLRVMFGTNRNKLWGDLDNDTARRLYHTLLPRTLIGLYQQGLTPDELAPLAFEARRAAKQYARERCHVPGRVMATAFDGFRHLKTYGNWSSKGLSWEELWVKYEDQVKQEMVLELLDDDEEEEECDISNLVCLKILERSCITNQQIDKLVLKTGKSVSHLDAIASDDPGNELLMIASRFENDVNTLLLESSSKFQRNGKLTAKEFFLLRFLVSTKKRFLMLQEFVGNHQNMLAPPEDEVKVWEKQDMTAPAA